MKKFIILISLVIVAGICPSNAQVTSEDEVIELLNGDILQLNKPPNSNLSFVRQIGDKNTAISIQEQEGMVSSLVMINQNGMRNAGYIVHSGSELKTYMWQYNLANEANLWSIGKNILTSVKQDGEGNIINSYIENDGINYRSAALSQDGNHNRIDLSLRGDGFGDNILEQTVIINQYGNQHGVKAHIEPFSVPIEINQNGGEGMKVNVSTSAFNFPMKK